MVIGTVFSAGKERGFVERVIVVSLGCERAEGSFLGCEAGLMSCGLVRGTWLVRAVVVRAEGRVSRSWAFRRERSCACSLLT